jgi:IclR family acetate operon transcriptional repressor
MRSDERTTPISVIGRVALLLGAFEDGQGAPGPVLDRGASPGLGISELARRTGLAKTTVHRLTQELLDHGLLERHGENLRLGLRLFELGELATRQRNLRDVAMPHMADLRGATGQTVHLAVLQGTDVVYIQILRSRTAPRLPSRVGGRQGTARLLGAGGG